MKRIAAAHRTKKATASILVAAWAVLATSTVFAALGHRAVGSGFGGDSFYATDAYPGFDGLDKLKTPEKKEKSWFLSVSRDTPAEQLAYAKEEEAAGNLRSARRACDALVREWPVSPEAPVAQLMLAMIWAQREEDYEEAFAELNYVLDFYSREVNYTKLVEYQYKLANTMVKNRKTFWGMSFTSLRVLRQNYEMIVRRAPGAAYVPEAMLQIASLREQDQQYEEAVEVYSTLVSKFPVSVEARKALYLGSKARMWLVRRHAYNQKRCQDMANHLKRVLRLAPDHENAEEMTGWLNEITEYLAEDAFSRAKFYDTKQRSRHASAVAYERFLKEYPQSRHADEARARIRDLIGKHAAEGRTEPEKPEEGKKEGVTQ